MIQLEVSKKRNNDLVFIELVCEAAFVKLLGEPASRASERGDFPDAGRKGRCERSRIGAIG